MAGAVGLDEDLTEALAHSNNYYFANLGVKLGYEKVSFYAHEFGYGDECYSSAALSS